MNQMTWRSIAVAGAATLVLVGGLLMIAPGPAHGALMSLGILLEMVGFSILGIASIYLGKTQRDD